MRTLLVLCACVALGQKKGGGKGPFSGQRKVAKKKAVARSGGPRPGGLGDEFKVFKERMDWQAAAKKCRQEGLELAQIDTLADAARIYAATGSMTWLGLKSISGRNGSWRWRSTEKALPNKTPWGRGQPNNEGDILCGYIATKSGTLADASCNYKFMVACSTRSTPKLKGTERDEEKEQKQEAPRAARPGFQGPSAKFSPGIEIPEYEAPAEEVSGKKVGLDLSGENRHKWGIVNDYIHAEKRKHANREVFVNYDTNTDGQTGFTDTLDPEIEYIEADGVLMFHLDFEQNPQRHCTGLDDFGNQLWPEDMTQRPMFLDSCQDQTSFLPDLYPETQVHEYLPECNGTPGDCGDLATDPCCNVHQGMNWTQAVCKCREYGGDIATPYDEVQDQYMFDFITSIMNNRFNYSNPKYCDPNAAQGSLDCPILGEGLNKLNWGNLIIWIGYNFDEDANGGFGQWQMVNGTDLDFNYHYFGLKGSDGSSNRKRRALDEINVVPDNNGNKEMTITINNQELYDNANDVSIVYNDQKSPVCIGVIFDVDPADQVNKLQWREKDCDRAKNVMCEVDFRNTGKCAFGNVPKDDANYEELTKVTTDPFGIDPDRCVDWAKCDQGEIVTGRCALDERFDTVLRRCMPATLVDNCNIDECTNTTHVCTGLHMHCEDTIGTYACICDEGYRWQDGKDVGTSENPSGRVPTPDNNFWVYDVGSDPTNDLEGSMVNGNGLYDPGQGDTCVDYDECANGQACMANSICSNLDIVATGRPYECLCDTGFEAVYNESTRTTDLQGNSWAELIECADIDECLSGTVTCSGPTQCVNIEGSFHCGCNAGYLTDDACVQCIEDGKQVFPPDSDDQLCVAESDGDCCSNIDECDDVALNLCPADSDCIDNDGSFFCDCHDETEYIREVINPNTNLWVCADKDECSDPMWNQCDPNSACVNLDPLYYCPCNEGWDNCADINIAPEGTCCEDRDECALDAPCAPFADCTNSIGLFNVSSIDDIWRVIGYSCACKPGFIGEGYNQCLDIDECDDGSHGCDENSKCVNTGGNYLCLCNNGYTVDQFKNEFYNGRNPDGTTNEDESCSDLDECQEGVEYNACDGNATCTDTDGSYECECLQGYEGDGYKCLDIQECLDPTTNDCDEGIIRPLQHEGTGICVNFPGGYDCECEEGFFGDGFDRDSGSGCDDVDECAANPCHVDGVCSNTVGSFVCTCQEGYVMKNDGSVDCEDVNECDDPGVCHEDATCANSIGTYACTCIDGYDGDGAFCADINECVPPATNDCDQVADCTNTDASYTCTCPEGYLSSGDPDGQVCTEIDECTDGGHNCDPNATCDNTPGGWTCTCNIGYVGTGELGDQGEPGCVNELECETGNHDCDPLADCTDTVGSYDCLCFDGYESFNTPLGRTGDCNNIDECADPLLNDCDTNALCLNLLPPDKFDCNCIAGYTDTDQDGRTCTLTDECAEGTHNCDPNATCNKDPALTGFTCTCNAGWEDRMTPDGLAIAAGLEGLSCIDIDECVVNEPCSDNALCENLPGTWSCGCEPGFQGPNPDNCADIDECADPLLNTCHADADCTNIDGSFTCACKPGYFGTGFLCDDIDECLTLADTGCDDNANCVNDIGTYHCECFVGFMSPNGTARVGDCIPRDECVETPEVCPAPADGGVCVDLPPNQNGYRCECMSGYEYVLEHNFCQDIDECLGFPCPDGAECTNLEPSFSCACAAGYTTNGTLAPAGTGFCEEYDECKLGTHSCNTTTELCVNTFGSHLCLCLPGYFLDDDGNCADVDECQQALCPAEATGCSNSVGGFTCQCPEGFEGTATFSLVALDTVSGEVVTAQQQSFECGDRDQCVAIVGQGCPQNSQCQNILGGDSCECGPGFTDQNGGADPFNPVCVDVDECANSPCTYPGASCANSEGSYECFCPTGLQGDGINCANIDECTNGQSIGVDFGAIIDVREMLTNRQRRQADVGVCPTTAICVDTEGSYFCVCPNGMRHNNVTNECDDIDECTENQHTCLDGESCLNFPGGHSCFLIPRTTKTPIWKGDPHIVVQYKDEPAVCFEVMDDDQSYLSVLADLETGLEVNGQVITESVKKQKSRLETVGIRSPRGVEVGIFTDAVTIGTEGKVHYRYSYKESVSQGVDDVHIVVHPVEKGTPQRGVTVSVGSDSEVRFNVMIKNSKESMIFKIERSEGLSANLAGLLGQTMRGEVPYHIDEDGVIHVNDREIHAGVSEWSAAHGCKNIATEWVEVFLGHPVREYRVDTLFSQLKASWLDAVLEAIGLPKRR